jgi:hypothetical protein
MTHESNTNKPVQAKPNDQRNQSRANEQGHVAVSAFFRIWDPATKKIHVEGRA